MNLTDEQQQIIEETTTNNDGEFHICAVAGSGKSFTIFQAIDYIKQDKPNAKILYVIFNKANQESAQLKLMKYADLPGKVKAQTAHSYAYGKWTKVHGKFQKIFKLDKDVIRKVLEKRQYFSVRFLKYAVWHYLHDKYVSSKLLLDTFCDDFKLKFDDDYEGPDKATDCTYINSKGRETYAYGIQINAYAVCIKECVDAFKDIIEAHEKQNLYTDGMYLKYAAYSNKSGGDEWDYVFFDEAQDSNYFMLKLLDKQTIHKLYFVGDERQSIYNFGGSNENVFKIRVPDKIYTLSTSFRFDKEVAHLANEIIHMHSSQTCYGTPQIHQTDPNSYARLYRTNATLFKEALSIAYDAKQNDKKLYIDFMRGTNDDDSYKYNEFIYFLSLYYRYTDYYYWKSNMHIWPKYAPESLKVFETVLEESENFLDTYNELYDALSDDIHSMFSYAMNETDFVEKYIALQNCLSYADYDEKITMITMHRSKGLEWDSVCIAEPTRLYYKDKEGVVRRNSDFMSELNLAYVAITRARKFLYATALKDELCLEDSKFYDIDFVIDVDKNREIQDECEKLIQTVGN